jgi:hypothetical protein
MVIVAGNDFDSSGFEKADFLDLLRIDQILPMAAQQGRLFFQCAQCQFSKVFAAVADGDIDTAGFRGGIFNVVNLDQQHPMMPGTGDLLERRRCIEQRRTGRAVAAQALERDVEAGRIDRF